MLILSKLLTKFQIGYRIGDIHKFEYISKKSESILIESQV